MMLLAGPAAAQRLVQSISDNWLFSKDLATFEASSEPQAPRWEKVSLPHTWNAADVLDDAPGYYRGVGWYRKTLFVPPAWQRRRLYLRFEAANQE
ncbi:MAG: beta-galactosidase, partial [Hymenobacter sp.]